MALPNDEVLSNPKFADHWRPDAEAESLWNRFPYKSFKPSGANIKLNVKILKNPSATDAVLLVTGFNEPMMKYVQTAFDLYSGSQGSKGFSVVLFDHRGQGLSDRDPRLSLAGGAKTEQNGHWEDFDDECVADFLAVAKHASEVLCLSSSTSRPSPDSPLSSSSSAPASVPAASAAASSETAEKVRGEGRLHLVAHSMGGLIATHGLAAAPKGLFTGRVVLSCPMFETYWGDVPALSMPRAVSAWLGALGTWLGWEHCLAPAPGARLSWWDPAKPIQGVCLTHDRSKLTWLWALRTMHPRVALMGPSMGWIREMTTAQSKTLKRVAEMVARSHCWGTSNSASPPPAPAPLATEGAVGVEVEEGALAFPATLVLTAQHDMLVKESGQAAFVRTLAAAATNSNKTSSASSSSVASALSCWFSPTTNTRSGGGVLSGSRRVCAVRVVVQGSYHEPLFEEESIRCAVTAAVLSWLQDSPTSLPTPPPTVLPLSSSSPAREQQQQHTSSSSLSEGKETVGLLAPPNLVRWCAAHVAAPASCLKLVQTAPFEFEEAWGHRAVCLEPPAGVVHKNKSRTLFVVCLGVVTVGATILLGRRRHA